MSPGGLTSTTPLKMKIFGSAEEQRQELKCTWMSIAAEFCLHRESEVLGNVWERRDLITTAVQIIYWGKNSRGFRYGPRLEHNELNHEMNKPPYCTVALTLLFLCSQVPALAGCTTVPSNLTNNSAQSALCLVNILTIKMKINTSTVCKQTTSILKQFFSPLLTFRVADRPCPTSSRQKEFIKILKQKTQQTQKKINQK